MLAMQQGTHARLGSVYHCFRCPDAGRSRMGCCPSRPTCWRKGCGVEATVWQATMGSAESCANGVVEQRSMVWWFRVIVRQHA